MTKVYGKIESLKRVRDTLYSHNIRRFKSIADINDFWKSYEAEIDKIKKENARELTLERETIKAKKVELTLLHDSLREQAIEEFNSRHQSYTSRINYAQSLYSSQNLLKPLTWTYSAVLKYIQSRTSNSIEAIISRKTQPVRQELDLIELKIEHLTKNSDSIIDERSASEINEILRIKGILEELNPLIAGAIGEGKVHRELEKLPGNNVLFNDFRVRFDTPIYNKKEKDRIHSIQIDHLLVTHSGIFILETKNWSKKSLQSLDLRSPVKQLKRNGYAMFVVLNSTKQRPELYQHHWGEKKIPIRSVVVMINEKPKGEFKYVAVKNLYELNNYITYFEPIFDDDEVDMIADYLMGITSDVDQSTLERDPFPSTTPAPRRTDKLDLSEWFLKNPGKGINEYYKDLREGGWE